MKQLAFAGLIMAVAVMPVPLKALAFDYKGVAETSLNAHIRPSYARLQQAVARLDGALADYCSQPTDKTSAEVYSSYEHAVQSWGRVEHLRFGPVTEKHRYERFAFWPDAKALGKRQVLRAIRKKDKNVLDPAKLAKKSVALQGLTALEIILYSKSRQPVFSPGKGDPFRCGYAMSINANLVRMANEIVKAWGNQGRYSTLWLAPGQSNPLYLNEKEVIQELVQSYSAGLEQTREKRLVDPMGIRPTQKIPSRSPFERSNLNLPFLIANVEGLRDLYIKSDFMKELNSRHNGRGDSLNTEFNIVLSTLRSIDVSQPQPFSDPDIYRRLIPAGYPLKNLFVLGTDYLSEAADLSLGFNATDGD